jgi:hypothetical protein
MLLLIVIWVFFMRRVGGKGGTGGLGAYYVRSQQHMERAEDLLGRIATALERR